MYAAITTPVRPEPPINNVISLLRHFQRRNFLTSDVFNISLLGSYRRHTDLLKAQWKQSWVVIKQLDVVVSPPAI